MKLPLFFRETGASRVMLFLVKETMRPELRLPARYLFWIRTVSPGIRNEASRPAVKVIMSDSIRAV
ncbi:hypothetical protein AOD72_00375 [Klebsiella pneumoniae subsp. pneumoniae]|nr:hypothetical protein AOD72_00375 [Klebsiella pneumoniae subsp. pneumoniae]